MIQVFPTRAMTLCVTVLAVLHLLAQLYPSSQSNSTLSDFCLQLLPVSALQLSSQYDLQPSVLLCVFSQVIDT